MDGRPAGRRRAGDLRVPGVGRLLAALGAGLYRRLADDADRAQYWVRHVRYGVLLSELGAGSVLAYVLLTPSAGRHSVLLLVLSSAVMVGTPALLLLPLARMVQDHRGPLLFYGWSSAVTALVTIASRVDGGAGSPIPVVLFLTLGFMAAVYPPYGVAATGTLMTGCYLFFIAAPDLEVSALFVAVILAAFTVLCAMASANQWGAYERQAMLLRTHEVLAATDPLTGCLNRRAFLDRLDRAVAAAGAGATPVVCVVDLDGFKGVNDRDGHAAGDAVLRAVTAALSGVVRETDAVARLGGDEFAVLAAAGHDGDGAALAARLRAAVATVGAGCGVTASIGMTPVLAGDDVHEVLGRADRAMYRAKAGGGDRVAALAQ